MAKRSFDIGPKRKDAAPQARRKKRRKQKKEELKKTTHPRLSTRSPKRKLRDRRREEQMRHLGIMVASVAITAGIILYILWLPGIRISTVRASGFGDVESLEAIAKSELKGTYGGIIPKNSFLFYPERAIRAAILEEFPGIAAVSISRTSLDAISLKASERTSAFWWCGTPGNLSARTGTCYEADAEGLVFARAVESSAEEATSTAVASELRVYAELDAASSTGAYPIKARVMGASALPNILKFVKTTKALGVPVASIAIRGDEADLFVPPTTRITYVVGHENEAAKSASAAFPTLNLVDGSLIYVDLRFDGKVYLKRVGE
jgi:cell division septal protein FtsQ